MNVSGFVVLTIPEPLRRIYGSGNGFGALNGALKESNAPFNAMDHWRRHCPSRDARAHSGLCRASESPGFLSSTHA